MRQKKLEKLLLLSIFGGIAIILFAIFFLAKTSDKPSTEGQKMIQPPTHN